MASPKLVANVDYYMENGKMVLTAHFLLKRGYCCNSGCRHCPYKGESMPQANVNIIGLPGPGDSAGDSSSET